MAQHGKPWHVCDDCIDPLASDLFALAERFRRPFDVAKRDQLDVEYRQIIESVGWDNDRLTCEQKKRLGELSQQLGSQTEPPSTQDVWSIYNKYNIDLATDWLKFNVSVEFGDDFNRKLLGAKKRFSDLDFKACQIINGDLGKESTTQIRYAIRRLIDRHYELLRKAFPDHESHPDRDELPDDLRAFEIQILDEYTNVEIEFRETATYLRRVSALVRSKLAKARTNNNPAEPVEAPQTATRPKLSTEPGEDRSGDQATVRLLSVFTDGLADERLGGAVSVLQDDNLTVNEKLTRIDRLFPFPPTVSAEKLGHLVGGVSKQAVMKTDWWIKNRKGEKNSEIGRRQDTHRQRAKQHESDRTNDEDE